MPYDLGDTVRLVGYARDPGGGLVTADTAVLTITLPDGTTATPVVPAPTPAGTYTVDYPTTVAGRHVYRWVFSGPASAHVDVFDVRPAAPLYVISLAEAKHQLNITTTTHDEALRRVIEATTTAIEDHIGEVVVRRSFTERALASGGRAVLIYTPVASITTAASMDGNSTWSPADLDVDPLTGLVRAVRGPVLRGWVDFVYVAGPQVIRANVSEAAEIIVQHLWETTRAKFGGPRPGGMEDSYGIPGRGFGIPNAARELLGDPPPQGG